VDDRDIGTSAYLNLIKVSTVKKLLDWHFALSDHRLVEQ
jgi:hypothetical protein